MPMLDIKNVQINWIINNKIYIFSEHLWYEMIVYLCKHMFCETN